MAFSSLFSVSRQSAASIPALVTKATRTFSNLRGSLLSPVARQEDDRRLLRITWDSSKTTIHPYTWLKDCCQCESCAHRGLEHRRTLLQNLDLKCTPKDIRFDDDAQQVHILWNDEHRSEFHYQWLADRCHSPEEQKRQQRKLNGPPQSLWNETFKVKAFKFDEVINKQSVMYELLCNLQEFGLSTVTGMPKDDGLEKFVNAIAYPQLTYYGHYYYVMNKANPSSLGYTPAAINFHADIPAYANPPDIQMLFCMSKKDIEGGDNIFSDAFYSIEEIRKEDPPAFKMLTEVPVQFRDFGTDYLKDYYMLTKHFTVELNADGRPSRVYFSQQLRDHYPHLSLDQVDGFYFAYKLLNEKMLKHAVSYEQKEGQLVIYDNTRVVHGRYPFRSLSEEAERKLKGCYMSWDELRSRMRRIKFDLQLFD